MYLENYPSYGATSKGLAAPYTLDFGKDLSHYIGLRATWQGGPVAAKTLYVNNYNNNFELTVTMGIRSEIVPAYSQGYIDIAGCDDVTISSASAGKVPVTVLTYSEKPGFSARGNAPYNPSTSPYSISGSINIASANNADSLMYPGDGFLYALCNSKKLLLKIDPKTNVLVDVFDFSASVSETIYSSCGGPTNQIIIGCTAKIYVFDCVSKTLGVGFNPYNGPTNAKVYWNSFVNKIFTIDDFNPAGTGDVMSLNIDGSNVIRSTTALMPPNQTAIKQLTMDTTTSGLYVWGVENNTGNSMKADANMNLLVQTTLYSAALLDAKRVPNRLLLCVGGAGNAVRSYDPVTMASHSDFTFTPASGITYQRMCYNPDNNQLAIISSSTIDFVDLALKGVIATASNTGTINDALYVPDVKRYYLAKSGAISYINM